MAWPQRARSAENPSGVVHAGQASQPVTRSTSPPDRSGATEALPERRPWVRPGGPLGDVTGAGQRLGVLPQRQRPPSEADRSTSSPVLAAVEPTVCAGRRTRPQSRSARRAARTSAGESERQFTPRPGATTGGGFRTSVSVRRYDGRSVSPNVPRPDHRTRSQSRRLVPPADPASRRRVLEVWLSTMSTRR